MGKLMLRKELGRSINLENEIEKIDASKASIKLSKKRKINFGWDMNQRI